MLHFSHNYNDAQFGLLVAAILPLLGASLWLYNAYRLGKLKWKPTRPANPRLVTLVIFIGIILAVAWLATVG